MSTPKYSAGIIYTDGVPSWTPTDENSLRAVNRLTGTAYKWNGSAWVEDSGATYTPGEGIDITSNVISVTELDRLRLDTTPETSAGGVGIMVWNDTDGTADLGLKGGNVTLQIGQEQVVRVVNKSGSTIANGSAVYISGAQWNRVKVDKAIATSENADKVIGIATEDISNNAEGFITISGLVRNLDTSAFSEGAALYVSASTAGALTSTAPTAPNHAVIVGYVVNSNASTGSVFVHPHAGGELSTLHDVVLTGPTNGQVLTYNSGTGVWVNEDADGGVTWPLLAPDGGYNAPSYSFSNEDKSGLSNLVDGIYFAAEKNIEMQTFPSSEETKDINITTGASSNKQSGSINITTGAANNYSGDVNISTGTATQDGGGNINVVAGNGEESNGGSVNITSGSTNANFGFAGNVIITTGTNNQTATAGNILLTAGVFGEPSTLGFVAITRQYTPAETADINGVEGSICWDENYIYIKTPSGWKRSELFTF